MKTNSFKLFMYGSVLLLSVFAVNFIFQEKAAADVVLSNINNRVINSSMVSTNIIGTTDGVANRGYLAVGTGEFDVGVFAITYTKSEVGDNSPFDITIEHAAICNGGIFPNRIDHPNNGVDPVTTFAAVNPRFSSYASGSTSITAGRDCDNLNRTLRVESNRMTLDSRGRYTGVVIVNLISGGTLSQQNSFNLVAQDAGVKLGYNGDAITYLADSLRGMPQAEKDFFDVVAPAWRTIINDSNRFKTSLNVANTNLPSNDYEINFELGFYLDCQTPSLGAGEIAIRFYDVDHNIWQGPGTPNGDFPDLWFRLYRKPKSGGTFTQYQAIKLVSGDKSFDEVDLPALDSSYDYIAAVEGLSRPNALQFSIGASPGINLGNDENPICLNTPPTVTVVGTPNCTTFTVIVNDEDGDAVNIALQVNNTAITGAGSGEYNLVNQTANNTQYTFRTEDWRDFNARNFRVVVSDQYAIAETSNLSVGPCLNMACGGATVTPGSLEVNEPFSISVNFIMRYIAGGGNATIGSRGQAVTYNVNLDVSPLPGVAPANPVVGTTTIPAGGTNSILTHNIGGFRASNDPTNYDIAYRLNGVNNANATSVPCPTAGETAGVTSSSMPYIQVFRGDVIAGYGVKNNQGICTTTANAGVRARSRTLVGTTELVGSGTQMAVFALGPVQGFRSAITDSATGVNSRPWQRIFANSTESGNSGVAATDSNFSQNFGGSFNSSLCAENWSEGIPNVATPTSGDIDVATVFNVVRYDGNVRLNASAPLTGSRKIYVDGDVIIGNASGVIQQLVYNAGPWGSVFEIPSFTLIATGNIIIDENVDRLDGVFVSGGTVFTCAPTGSTLPVGAQNVTTYSPGSYRLGGQCNTVPLSLHGAIVANSIRLWRTGGTLSQSVNGSSTGLQSYVDGLTRAETFRLPPEVFVAPRFGEEPANGSAGKKQLDSLISLPPPF